MDEVKFAGFWIRLIAWLVDVILLTIITSAPLFSISEKGHSLTGDLANDSLALFGVLLVAAVPIGLTVWFWLRFAATPGKMLPKIKIVDSETMSPLSTKQAVIRYLGYYLSILVLGLGYLSIGLRKRKQGWHDLLASTVVIRR